MVNSFFANHCGFSFSGAFKKEAGLDAVTTEKFSLNVCNPCHLRKSAAEIMLRLAYRGLSAGQRKKRNLMLIYIIK